ncbi:hypothetical protein ACWV26_08365 [Rummeliibacillus sp. JY-2-4R]
MEVTFLTTPESYGEIPFYTMGNILFECGLYFEDKKEEKRINFCVNWIEKINNYPIYYLFEVYDFMTLEIDKALKKKKIQSTRSVFQERYYYKGIFQNIEQLIEIFPYIYGSGSMEQFAAISLNEDVIDFQETVPIIKMKENAIVIAVDVDGDSILFLSNDHDYKNISELIESLPNNVQYRFNE